MTEETKVAVVTGSALNFGRAIALPLAREGFSIIVTARQSEHGTAETARLVRQAGGHAAVPMADISGPAQARGLVESAIHIPAGSMCL